MWPSEAMESCAGWWSAFESPVRGGKGNSASKWTTWVVSLYVVTVVDCNTRTVVSRSGPDLSVRTRAGIRLGANGCVM